MASLQEILRPQVLTRVISRMAAADGSLLRLFGMQAGGPSETHVGHGREGVYHVYNNVRTIGQGRAPGTPAGRTSRQKIGRVPFVYPRLHEQISLLAEELHNVGRIDNPAVRDQAGEDYIRRQTQTLAQRGSNWRTALLVGMLRDSLYVFEDGDTWYPSYTSASSLYQISFGMPAGNKSQLDMTGTGDLIDTSWASTTTANIPKQLLDINAAFQRLNGGMLTDVILPVQQWSNIISNDFVSAVHGSATSPFTVFERKTETGPDGTQINEFAARLITMPQVMFHVTDAGLEVGAPGSETFTKHVEDNNAIFISRMPGVHTMYTGSEPISEYDNGPKTVKVGFSAWSKESSNPTSTEVFVLDNALPVNEVPTSIAYGTVEF